MAKQRLTDRTISAMKPAPSGTRYERLDSVAPGLIVRVTDRGHKTFMLKTRFPGSPHPTRRELGKVGALGLAEARTKANAWIDLIGKGIDPGEQEERERREKLQRRANTFASVAEDFISGMEPTERQRDVVARDIRREFIPALGTRPIADITRADIRAIIVAAKNRGAPHQARNLLGYVRRVFNWAIEQDAYGLDRSPCEALRPKTIIGPKQARKRVLEDAELRALWKAADTIPYPYGPLYKLLALTGARKSELAEARWSEIDLAKRVLVIPHERHKQDEAHVIPLCDDALAILAELPRFEAGDYLFSTTAGRQPVNGFSKAKTILDKTMLTTLRKGIQNAKEREKIKLEAFVIHDIRRTMRTNLSALPIPQHVAERIIGHAQPGLIQVYDRFAYLEEKRAGLALWEGRLRSIIDPSAAPDAGNVILWTKQANRT